LREFDGRATACYEVVRASPLAALQHVQSVAVLKLNR
jgi:hypothetical protein